jgi:hypothetical protein
MTGGHKGDRTRETRCCTCPLFYQEYDALGGVSSRNSGDILGAGFQEKALD